MCWRGISNDLGAQMTRYSTSSDEHRAKCITSITKALYNAIPGSEESWPIWKAEEVATATFDALNGIARVDPIEATGKMIAASDIYWQSEFPGFPTMADVEGMWRAMSAAGDLTNPAKPEYPEGKP
jgi:hypothetical protein